MSSKKKDPVDFKAIQLITSLDKDEITAMMELQDEYYETLYDESSYLPEDYELSIDEEQELEEQLLKDCGDIKFMRNKT